MDKESISELQNLLDRVTIVEAQLFSMMAEDVTASDDSIQTDPVLSPPPCGMPFYDSQDSTTTPLLSTLGFHTETDKLGEVGIFNCWDSSTNWKTRFKIPFLPKDSEGSGITDWTFLDSTLANPTAALWAYRSVDMVSPNVIQLYNFDNPPAIPSATIPRLTSKALIRMPNVATGTTNIEYATLADMQQWLGLWDDSDDVAQAAFGFQQFSVQHLIQGDYQWNQLYNFDSAHFSFSSVADESSIDGTNKAILIRDNSSTIPTLEYISIAAMNVASATTAGSVDAGNVTGLLIWLEANYPITLAHSALSDLVAGNGTDQHMDSAHGGTGTNTTYLNAAGGATRNAMGIGSGIGDSSKKMSVNPDLHQLCDSTGAAVLDTYTSATVKTLFGVLVQILNLTDTDTAGVLTGAVQIAGGLSTRLHINAIGGYLCGTATGQTLTYNASTFFTGGILTGSCTFRRGGDTDENTVFLTIT